VFGKFTAAALAVAPATKSITPHKKLIGAITLFIEVPALQVPSIRTSLISVKRFDFVKYIEEHMLIKQVRYADGPAGYIRCEFAPFAE
jgi:hypothetical protein